MIDKKLSLTSIRLQALQKIETATDNLQFSSNPSLDSVSDEASNVSPIEQSQQLRQEPPPRVRKPSLKPPNNLANSQAPHSPIEEPLEYYDPELIDFHALDEYYGTSHISAPSTPLQHPTSERPKSKHRRNRTKSSNSSLHSSPGSSPTVQTFAESQQEKNQSRPVSYPSVVAAEPKTDPKAEIVETKLEKVEAAVVESKPKEVEVQPIPVVTGNSIAVKTEPEPVVVKEVSKPAEVVILPQETAKVQEEVKKPAEIAHPPPSYEDSHQVIVVAANVPHNDNEAKAEIKNVRGRLKSIDRGNAVLLKPAAPEEFKVASDEEAKAAIQNVRTRLKSNDRSLGITPITEQVPTPKELTAEPIKQVEPVVVPVAEEKVEQSAAPATQSAEGGEEHHQSKFENDLEESKKKLKSSKSRSNSISDRRRSSIASKHDAHEPKPVASIDKVEKTPEVAPIIQKPAEPPILQRRNSTVKEAISKFNESVPHKVENPVTESESVEKEETHEEDYSSIRKALKTTGKLNANEDVQVVPHQAAESNLIATPAPVTATLKRKNSIVQDAALKFEQPVGIQEKTQEVAEKLILNRRNSVKETAAKINGANVEHKSSRPQTPNDAPIDAEQAYSSVKKGLKSTGKLSSIAQQNESTNIESKEKSVQEPVHAEQSSGGLKRKNSIVKDMAAKLDETIEHEKQSSTPQSPSLSGHEIQINPEEAYTSIRKGLKSTGKLPAEESPAQVEFANVTLKKMDVETAKKALIENKGSHQVEYTAIKSSLKSTGKLQEAVVNVPADSSAIKSNSIYGHKQLSVKFDEVSTPNKIESPKSPNISTSSEAEYSAIRSKLKSTGKLDSINQQKIEDAVVPNIIEKPVIKTEGNEQKLVSSSTVKNLVSKINHENVKQDETPVKQESFESVRKGLKSTGKLQIETQQSKISGSKTAADLGSPVEKINDSSIRQRSPTTSSIKSTISKSESGNDLEAARKLLKQTSKPQDNQKPRPASPLEQNHSPSPVPLRKIKTPSIPSSPKLAEPELPNYDLAKKVLKSTGKLQSEIDEAKQREKELQSQYVSQSPVFESKQVMSRLREKTTPVSSRPTSVVNAPAADLDSLKKSLKTTGKLDSNEDVDSSTKIQGQKNEELTLLRNSLKPATKASTAEPKKDTGTGALEPVYQTKPKNETLKKSIGEPQTPETTLNGQRRLSVGDQIKQINANNSQPASPLLHSKLSSPALKEKIFDASDESGEGFLKTKFNKTVGETVETTVTKPMTKPSDTQESSIDSLNASSNSHKSSSDVPVSPRLTTTPYQRRIIEQPASSNNTSTSSMTESANVASKKEYKPLGIQKQSPYGRKRFDDLDGEVQPDDNVDLVSKADEQARRLSNGGSTPLFERRKSNNYEDAKHQPSSRPQSSADAAPLFQRRRSSYDEGDYDSTVEQETPAKESSRPETPQRRKSILKKKQYETGDSDGETRGLGPRSRASTAGKEFTPIAIQKRATQETASAFNSNEDVESQLPSPPPRKTSTASSPEHTRNSVKEVAANDDAQLYLVKGRKKLVLQRVPLELKSIDLSNCFILDLPADSSAQASTLMRTLFVCSGLFSSKVRANKTIELANLMKDHDYGTKASIVIVDLSTVKYRNIPKDELYFWKNVINGKSSIVREVTKNEIVEKCDTIPKYAPNDSALDEVSEHEDPKLFRFEADKTLHPIYGDLDRHFLKTNGVYYLECSTELFVWVGSQVPDYLQKVAIKHAKEVKIETKLPQSIPYGIYTEREHDETTLFKQHFGDWNLLGIQSPKILEVKQITNIKAKDFEWKVYDRGSNTPKLQAIDIGHMYDSSNGHPFIANSIDKNSDGNELDPNSLIKSDWGFLNLRAWSLHEINKASQMNGVGLISINMESLNAASISFNHDHPLFLRSNDCFLFLYEYNEKPANLKDSILAARSNIPADELFEHMKQQYVLYIWIGLTSSVLDQSLVFHAVREIEKSVKRLNGLSVRGRHIRLVEGKETDHFINMTLGITNPKEVPERLKSAVIHTIDKVPAPVFFIARPSDKPDYLIMYRLACTNSGQVKVFEMPIPTYELLCSGFCYVLICESKIIIWNGFGSIKSEQVAALKFVNGILKTIPNMDLYQIQSFDETIGSDVVSKFFGNQNEQKRSNEQFWKERPATVGYATRLWKIHYFLNGNPTASEIESFSYQDLDDNHVYILDAYFKIVVWIGSHVGRAEEKSVNSEQETESSRSGFKELRLAVKTASHCLEYIVAKGRKITANDVLVMQSGHESPFFKSQFPYWENAEVKCDWPSLLSLKEATTLIEETKYPLETLKEFAATKQAPFGVDLQHLEQYLTEVEFIHVFGLEPPLFQKLADWRQAEHKKKVGLF